MAGRCHITAACLRIFCQICDSKTGYSSGYRFTASRAMIHLGVVVFWMASIKRRILQDSVRFYLLAVASLLIFWLYIRDVKWFFFL